jgi:hypothetical protein
VDVSQHSRRGTVAGRDGADCGKGRVQEGEMPVRVSMCSAGRVKVAHHCRRPTALDVLHDTVEDAYATTYREQQYRQQRPYRLDAPCSPPP